jgi:hypothetical protein
VGDRSFATSDISLQQTQSEDYWHDLQNTLDHARDRSTPTRDRLAYIRRIVDGVNVPFRARQSQVLDGHTEVETIFGTRIPLDRFAVKGGNCMYTSSTLIEVLAHGRIASPTGQLAVSAQGTDDTVLVFEARGQIDRVMRISSGTPVRDEEVPRWMQANLAEKHFGIVDLFGRTTEKTRAVMRSL